ncbi:lantibiotic dehydratase family protein [Chitinophaga filiformis]|uniref:lantibiotic dehydratase n=1 Tax=Chitinophaga filiformis TaxID=104663 RepID=UPI001F2D5F21|nr:lantibiotic dehydratase [Chitinophaga filiformis]MCF6407049.1 lantibiotic dehydratase family protein [Chitinophaga filiformis]
MTLTVFPHVFVRYTSLHQREMKVFDPSEDMLLQLSQIHMLEAQKEQSKSALCDQLFSYIQQATDDKKRQQLINLKRSVFNDKLTGNQTNVPALAPAITQHLELVEVLREATLQWQDVFQKEVTRYRQVLKNYAQHDLLCKGILLSSPTLYAQLPSFISRDVHNFRHKELKTEYSLLRYLTRMAFKTSPFSTFTHTGIAVPAEQVSDEVFVFSTDIKSAIRLNNKLFDYFRLLMVHHPELNEVLEIRLNPTIQQKGRHLQFLASYRNIESFQKMPVSDITNWLHSFLSSRQPVLLGTLTDMLSGFIADADRQQIKAYLLQLAANGFIETGIGCSGISPDWDEALISYLSAHEESRPAVKPLQQLLRFLHQQRQTYANAPAARRGDLLRDASNALDNTLRLLQLEAGLSDAITNSEDIAQQIALEVRIQKEGFNVTRFMLQQFPASGIFYEDTYSTTVNTYAPEATHSLVEKADRLCTLLESLDTMQAERVRMRDFFLGHFGPDQQVNVTDFYYTYYQLEKKTQKETLRIKSPQKEDTLVSQLRQLLKPADIAGTTGIVNLNATDFDIAYADTSTSRGMFIQLFRQEEELCGVINNLLPGMGKVAGRFLDLFAPDITSSFRDCNRKLHPDMLQLELSDGSSFNANIHPPLLPSGISIPGSHSNYPGQQLTSVENIAVKYNPGTELLSLVHIPDGREIFAYDLSLQSFLNRSNFYQLLAHFNPERRIPLRKLIEVTDEKYTATLPAPEADIICKPRITFEQHIILRRMAWVIKTASIPQQENNETDAAYYLRFNRWYIASGLPAHVFLFLKSYAIPMDKEEKLKMMKDDYKPQYICFTQPAMVGLFKKLLSRAGQYIYVEEMLPHLSHLQDATPVTEHLIHWYKY